MTDKPVMEPLAIRSGEQTATSQAERIPFDAELDVRQLACPMPVLRCKKSLSTMSSGQVLRILATDKEAPKDFEVFCRQTGNELLSSAEQNGEFVFYLRRR